MKIIKQLNSVYKHNDKAHFTSEDVSCSIRNVDDVKSKMRFIIIFVAAVCLFLIKGYIWV